MKIKILPEFHLGAWDGDIPREDKPFYTGKNKSVAFFLNNSIYLLSFLIPFIALLSFMIYYGFAPFGKRSLFVFEGTDTYLSFVQDVNHSLRNGSFSFFTLAGDAPGQTFGLIARYLLSPFTLMTLLFPANYALPLLSLSAVLRIALGGFCFTLFLTKRPGGLRYSKYNGMLLVFSLGYSLGSFALFHMSEFIYQDSFMLLPLFMLALEHFFENRDKTRSMRLLLCLSLLFQFEMGLKLAGFALFYLLLYPDRNLRARITAALCFLKELLIASMLSAIVLIPGLYGLYHTKAAFPDFGFVTDLFHFFLLHLFLHDPAYAAVFPGGANLYVGCFILLLAFIFLANRQLPGKLRIRRFCLFLLLLFSVQLTQASFAANLLRSFESSWQNQALFYCFFLLLMAADTIRDIRRIHPVALFFPLLLPLALAVLAAKFSVGRPSFKSVEYSLGLLLFFVILILLYRLGSIKRKTFHSLVLLICTAELLFHAENCIYDLSLEEVTLADCTPSYEDPERILSTGESLFPWSYTDTLDPKDDIASLPFMYTIPASGETFNNAKKRSTGLIASANETAMLLGATEKLCEPETVSATWEIDSPDRISVESLGKQVYHITQDSSKPIEGNPITAQRVRFSFTPSRKGNLYIHGNSMKHITEDKTDGECSYNYFAPQPSTETENLLLYLQAFYLRNDVLSKLSDALQNTRPSVQKLSAGRITLSLPDSEGEERMLITPFGPGSDFHFKSGDQKLNTDTLAEQTVVFLPAGAKEITIYVNLLPLYLGSILSLISLLCLMLFKRRRAAANAAETETYLKDRDKRSDSGILTPVLNIVSSFCRRNRIYLLSFFIPAGVFLLALLIGSCAPFGSTTIFNGDGMHIWLPEQIINSYLLKNGLPAHTFYGGGGYNTVVRDPSIWLQAGFLLFPASAYITVATFLVMLRISLSGLATAIYLTNRTSAPKAGRNDYRVLVAALAYSLCSFLLVIFNYRHWMHAYMLLPIILLGMDRLMTENKKRLLIFSLAASFIFCYYPTMFTCIYLVIRFFTYHFESFGDFIKKGLRFTLSAVCVGLLSFYTLYMALISLSGSTYGEADSVFPKSYLFNDFFYLLRRSSFLTHTDAISWSEGHALLYVGILPLILLFLYLFSGQVKVSEKLRRLLPICLIYISLNQSVLNYIWNGFHYQHGVPNRFVFLLSFLVAEIGYDALCLYPKEPRFKIAISVLLPSILLILSWLTAKGDEVKLSGAIATPALCLIYAFLIIPQYKHLSREKCCKVLSFLLLTELCVNAVYTISENRLMRDMLTAETADCEYLKEQFDVNGSLERVSMPGPFVSAYYAVNQIRCVDMCFGATLTDQELQMARYGGYFVRSNNVVANSTTTPMGNALMANRYIILSNRNHFHKLTDIAMYDIVGDTENSVIYKNDHIFPFAYYLPLSAEQTLAGKQGVSQFWTNFASMFVPQDSLFEKVELTSTTDPAAAGKENTYVYGIKDLQKSVNLTFTAPTDGTYYLFDSYYHTIGSLEAEDEMSSTYTVDYDVLQTELEDPHVISFHPSVFEKIRKEVDKNAMTISDFDETHMNGTITLPEDGLVNFSIPYDPCWKASVDGKSAETEMIGGAFLSVKAPAGSHEICLTYVDHRWILPLIFTILCWVAALVLCFKPKRMIEKD